MATIKELIKLGKIEFVRALGEDKALLIFQAYDPRTGKELDPTPSQLTIAGLENDLKNADAAVEAAVANRQEKADMLDFLKAELAKEAKKREAKA